MNAIAIMEKSPVEEFVSNVLPADRMDELARALPAHIKPAMFQRNLLNAVMINPDLMSYSPGLVFREVSKAAALGLFLDPQLGEAYIVIAYNYKTKQNEPQLRVGYRGMVKLARQSGEIAQIYAHEVHANDVFECTLGTHKDLLHKPKVFGDRGEIIGYYAVAKYRDGTDDFEPMAIADILAIRDRSDAYKAFKANKIKSTPWSTDEGEMCKKTNIRRLVKRLPQSPELAEAIRIEDRAEFPNFIDGERRPAQTPRIAPPPPPAPSAAPEDAKAETDAPMHRTVAPPRPAPAAEPARADPDAAPEHKPLDPKMFARDPAFVENVAFFRERAEEASLMDDVEEAWSDFISPMSEIPDAGWAMDEANVHYQKAKARLAKK